MATALLLAAAGLAWQNDTGMLDLLLWIFVLLVQSVPYLATTLVSVVSAFPGLRSDLVCGSGSAQAQIQSRS